MAERVDRRNDEVDFVASEDDSAGGRAVELDLDRRHEPGEIVEQLEVPRLVLDAREPAGAENAPDRRQRARVRRHRKEERGVPRRVLPRRELPAKHEERDPLLERQRIRRDRRQPGEHCRRLRREIVRMRVGEVRQRLDRKSELFAHRDIVGEHEVPVLFRDARDDGIFGNRRHRERGEGGREKKILIFTANTPARTNVFRLRSGCPACPRFPRARPFRCPARS